MKSISSRYDPSYPVEYGTSDNDPFASGAAPFDPTDYPEPAFETRRSEPRSPPCSAAGFFADSPEPSAPFAATPAPEITHQPQIAANPNPLATAFHDQIRWPSAL